MCKSPLLPSERVICDTCYQRINFIRAPYCQLCGRPLRRAGLCRGCEKRGRAYTIHRSVGIYDGVLAHAVKSLKYGHRFSIAKKLGRMMAATALANEDMRMAEVTVPVPLHRVRQRERGYNQALLLAREVCREMNLPLLPGALVRTRYTTQQTRLSRRDRRTNLIGAFNVVDPDAVREKLVLLIDDVTTTGATLEESAEALLKAGSSSVYCLTAAFAMTDTL